MKTGLFMDKTPRGDNPSTKTGLFVDETSPKNNPSTKQGVFVDGPERAPRLCGIDKGFKVFGGVGGEKDAGKTEDTQNQ